MIYYNVDTMSMGELGTICGSHNTGGLQNHERSTCNPGLAQPFASPLERRFAGDQGDLCQIGAADRAYIRAMLMLMITIIMKD